MCTARLPRSVCLQLTLFPITPPLLSPQMCSELDILDTELLQFQQDSALPNVLGGTTPSLSLTYAECRAGAWVVVGGGLSGRHP